DNIWISKSLKKDAPRNGSGVALERSEANIKHER
ncbi:EEPD1 isoform 3, partial [Pan troglodytes]